jgi:hypothetical protein
MASKHNQQLTKNSSILSQQDHEELNAQARQLDFVRSDLEGMAYERVVLDVLTRDAIQSAKRKGKEAKSGGVSQQSQRSQGSRTRRPLLHEPKSIPSQSKPSTAFAKASPSVEAITTGATPSLDDYIPIPSYHSSQHPVSSTSAPSGPHPQTLSTKRTIPSSQHASLTIGSKSTKMMQGSLPPEIAFLANNPLNDDKRRPVKTG